MTETSMKTKSQLEKLLREAIPADVIKTRQGSDKKEIEYVQHEWLRKRLLDVFGLNHTVVIDHYYTDIRQLASNRYVVTAASRCTLTIRYVDEDLPPLPGNSRIMTNTFQAVGADNKRADAFPLIAEAISASGTYALKNVLKLLGEQFGLDVADKTNDGDDDKSAESPSENKAKAASSAAAASKPADPPKGQPVNGSPAKSAGSPAPSASAPAASSAAAQGSPSADKPVGKDATKADLEAAGFKGKFLDQLLAYGNELVSKDVFKRAYGALSPVVGAPELNKMIAEVGINPTNEFTLNGPAIRRLSYLAGMAAKQKQKSN